jgi:phage baseplate assembly protein W
MPLIQNTKRINPLDLNNNVRIGVAFPLNDINMAAGTQTTREQLKTNLLNILLTVPGERINNPNYGIGLKNQVFENNIDSVTLQENINGQLAFWLPEVIITEVIVQQNIEQYRVSIKLNYSISLDETEDSIQINYS